MCVVHQGWAWVVLCLAFAVHIVDEALTDFLAVYNPVARAIREAAPFLPLPVFSFAAWLTVLILAVIALLCLTPFAFRGERWMTPLSYVFGAVMLGNGLLHVVGSFLMGGAMPGVYSSPLLLGASVYLLASAHRARNSTT